MAARGPPRMAEGWRTTEGDGPGQRPGGPDFQQLFSRMPAVELAELQKGDAVMIVATQGTAASPSTVIILLSGVEPILTRFAPPASTILSPWNLSTGGVVGMAETP